MDPAWQTVAQRALYKAHIANGAVVVLDVKTNEALAIAGVQSKRVDPTMALSAQTPGSIFKLVTAAAALDAFRYRPDSQFYCSGGIHIPGISMNCWTAHGALSLIAAIAESCDTTFAEVGMALGRVGLETETRRLHLGETHLQSVDGRPVLAEAEAGTVFRRSGADAGAVGQYLHWPRRRAYDTAGCEFGANGGHRWSNEQRAGGFGFGETWESHPDLPGA